MNITGFLGKHKKLEAVIGVFKRIGEGAGEARVAQLSAAWAYTAVFALGPLLLVVISIAGLVFGAAAVNGELSAQLSSVMGDKTAGTIQKLVAGSHESQSGVIGLVIGLVGLLLAASGLVNQLRSGFDQIFAVQPKDGGGVKKIVLERAKNIAALLVGSGLIIASVIVSALVAAIGSELQDAIGVPSFVLEVINFLTLLGILGVLLGFMYRNLPDAAVPWRAALGGGLVVALLFTLGKTALAWIIGQSGAASAYGAAASFISLMLWFYYIGQILFLGAVGIKVWLTR